MQYYTFRSLTSQSGFVSTSIVWGEQSTGKLKEIVQEILKWKRFKNTYHVPKMIPKKLTF